MSDPRIPLSILAGPEDWPGFLAAGGPAALLTDLPAPPPGAAAMERVAVGRHRIGCACCGGRSPAALALDRLFQARVRGRCPWFERAAVLGPAAQAREALAGDVLTRARFREAGPAAGLPAGRGSL